jgi:hypothetical protein
MMSNLTSMYTTSDKNSHKYVRRYLQKIVLQVPFT